MSKTWQDGDIINATDLNSYEVLKDYIDEETNTISEYASSLDAKLNINLSSLTSTVNSLSANVTNINSELSSLIDIIYPIGSIFFSTNGTNPGTYLRNTKWVSFARGRTIFGVGNSSPFNNVLSEDGSASHTLTITELPAHTHSFISSYEKNTFTTASNTKTGGSGYRYNGRTVSYNTTAENTENTGEGAAFSILPPYITTYIWQRVSLENEVFLVDPALAVGENNAISWHYIAKDGATIQFKTGNDGTYSSNPPDATYQEGGTDTTFYIKGTYNEISSEVSATLPIVST